MFPQRFFGGRFFAARYFPKAGATSLFHAFWLANLNQQIGPTPQQPSPE